MVPAPSWRHRLKRLTRQRAFWILAAMLTGIGILHYLTAQVRFLPLTPFSLGRHAVERIILLVPVIGATFVYGQAGGLVTLALTVLIMLPRAFFMSPSPADALVVTAAVSVVGYIFTWMIEIQESEKRLRQKAVSRLRAINEVSTIVTESLDLQQILTASLDKVLEVMGMETGLIFLVDNQAQELALVAHRGVSEETAAEVDRLQLGEGFCGRVALSGEPMVITDSSQDSRLTRLAVREEGLRSQAIVPLQSKGEVHGVLAAATREPRPFLRQELELITAIGNEIGVAIENARLYENMRFYVRKITQAQEEERKRIARDLHDDTTQALIVLSRRLEALATSREAALLPPAVLERIEELQRITDSVTKGVRRFSRDLRPSILDDLGLLPTLESLIGDLAQEESMESSLEVTGEPRRLSAEAELTLFRIAQEALTNVRKHARASKVAVMLQFSDGDVEMIIEDDGQGFTPPARSGDLASTGKLGLMGMQERARLLEGTLTVHAQPGQGTRVVANVPA